MSNKIIVDDFGTDIILDAGSDITSNTKLLIKYLSPTGRTGSWLANVHQTTKAKYTTMKGDIYEPGVWKLRIYVEMPTWSGHGNTAKLTVIDHWEI